MNHSPTTYAEAHMIQTTRNRFKAHRSTSSILCRRLLPALAGVLTFSTRVLRCGMWLDRVKVGDRRPGTNTLLTLEDTKAGIP